jgi:prolyl-tRNA synthetase
MLEEIQQSLFDRAKANLESRTKDCDAFEDYAAAVGDGGFFRIHWCGAEACETKIQQDTKSTIRCIPLDASEESGRCIVCGEPSGRRVIASQAY